MNMIAKQVAEYIQWARKHPDSVAKIAPLNEWVMEQCRKVSPYPPVILKSEPIADAQYGKCYLNALTAAECFGGNVVIGWSVWQNKVYLDLEHHAVWEQANGQRVDVTPQVLGDKEILFLELQIYSPEEMRDVERDLTAFRRTARNIFVPCPGTGKLGILCADCKLRAASFEPFTERSKYWENQASFYFDQVGKAHIDRKAKRQARKRQRQAKKRNR
jgi:hypothetical protein